MPRLRPGYAQGDEEIMNYKLQISNRAHKAPLCVSMGEAWVLPHQCLFYDNDVVVFKQYIATGRIFICNS